MSKNKKGLGKGLGALIPDIENIEPENIFEIDVQEIKPNDKQPRRVFDEGKLQELAQSIETHGVIQPLVVIKLNNGYQIVAGERRWRAAVEAGLKKVPVVIKDISQQEVMEIALIENLQREDLNDIETALAYKELMNKYEITQVEMARQLGKSRVSVTNTLRLLQLPRKVQQYIQDNRISAGHARVLLALPEQSREKFAQRIIDQKLSVRDTEQIISKEKQEDKKNENKEPNEKDVEGSIIIEMEEILQKSLGTKVHIKHNRSKGKIEINYYSNDDLERIMGIINNNVSRETLHREE